MGGPGPPAQSKMADALAEQKTKLLNSWRSAVHDTKKRDPKGVGGGVPDSPTSTPHNEPHDALIILRDVSWFRKDFPAHFMDHHQRPFGGPSLAGG